MFQAHRERVMDGLRGRSAAALFFTSHHKTRNADSEYRFRPSSDFFYLTGFDEPGAAVALLPGRREGEAPRTVLFLQPKDREKEIWTGIRLGVEVAPEILGVDEARPFDELWDALPELFAGYGSLVWRSGADPEHDRHFGEMLETLRFKARSKGRKPLEVLDPGPFIEEARLFKTADELELMRQAARITVEAHTAAMATAAPGVAENELDALLEYHFRRAGGTGASYTNIVAGGANACILHYVRNDQVLRDGDLCLIDAGCEFEYYASDVTRTFPVSGRFTAEQRAVYETVLRAQEASCQVVRPGTTFADVHQASLLTLVDGLIDLGLLTGTRDEALERGTYKRFFMHKTSHWIGLDVHDCGAYVEADGKSSRILRPGMALTIEPGLYIAPDDETVEARWRGIGVRIEDDLVVTSSGHENLTDAAPKTVEDVEAACAQRALAPTGA